MRLILIFAFCLFTLCSYTQIPNDDCRDAIEIFDGDVITVDFGNSRHDYVPSNSCDFTLSDENAWYKIVGTGDIVKLSLCRGNNHTIRIFEGGCSGLRCIDYVRRIGTYTDECNDGYTLTSTFHGELGKTYYIYCGTRVFYQDGTLHVEMIPPIENNTCQTAIEVDLDSTITYNITGTFSSGFIPCDGTRASSPDAWYSFQGTGGLVKILSSSNSFYQSVYKGDCEHFKCLPEIWINEEAAYETEVGKTYYIQLLFADLEEQTFSLHPVNIVENDDCENATILMTGDTLLATFMDTKEEIDACDPSSRGGGYDIWYQFEGNDSIFHFYPNGQGVKYRVLLGNCEEWECQTEALTRFIPTNGYSLKTEKGKNYFLNLYKIRGADTVEVYTHFTAAVENDTYLDALPINCTDTIHGTLLHAQNDRLINGTTNPSVWYTFKGTGNFHKVSAAFTGDESAYSPAVYYFKKENGQLTRASDRSNGYTYFEPDSIYYLNVVSNFRSNPFWLKLDCFPAVDHDECMDAKVILPLDTIKGSFSYASPTKDILCNNHNYGDIWYQIDGNGKQYNIGLVNQYSSYEIQLYRGTCDNLTCISSHNYSSSYNGISLEEGVKYYIKVYADRSSWSTASTFEIYFEELPLAANDICTKATPLTCGSSLIDSLDFAVANDRTCEGVTHRRGIWYSLKGTDNYYSINLDVHRGTPGTYDSGRNTFSLFEGGCDGLNCIDNLSNYQEDELVFFAESGKTYYLVYHFATSYYVSIDVDCVEYLDNDSLSNAALIECNIPYQGYTHENTYVDFNKCSANNVKKDIWFKMIGGGFYITCPNRSVTGVYTLDEGELQCYRDELYYRTFLEEGITYYFRVVPSDLEEDYIKSYDFEIICGEPLENSVCDAAVELNCNDSIVVNTLYAEGVVDVPECRNSNYGDNKRVAWYKITGDDSWKNLRITGGDLRLYEGVCGTLKCIGQETRLYAKIGVDYYIRVFALYGGYNEISLSMSCVEATPNDLCAQAQTIACGDTIRSNFNYINICDEGKDCKRGEVSKNVWYNITGHDGFVQLKIETNHYSVRQKIGIDIYENGCCYRNRPEDLYGNKNDLYFYAKKDTSYLIDVSFDDYYLSDYELIVNCISEEERTFNVCQNAYSLSANQTHSVNLANSISYYNYNYPDNSKPVHWVQFEGTGGIDTLEVDYSNSEISNVDLYLYIDLEQNCDLLNIQNSFAQHSTSSTQKALFTISTLQNIRYLVGIHSTQEADASQGIRITLKPNEPPKICELIFQDTLELEYGYTKRIPLDLSGSNGEFDVYLYDQNDKSEIRYFQNIEVGETFNVMPLSSGTNIVEYNGADCYGHALLNLKVSNVPSLDNDPCIEKPIICEEFIQHIDEELLDSTYQALKIESNAIIAYEAEVIYSAEEEVLLLPGFETEDESDFIADIKACDLEENTQNKLLENRTSTIALSKQNIELSLAPNPFKGETTVEYQIYEKSELSLSLFNAQGQLVRIIVPKQVQESGIYRQIITDEGIASGLYYLVFQTNKQKITQKLVLMK